MVDFRGRLVVNNVDEHCLEERDAVRLVIMTVIALCTSNYLRKYG